MPIYNVISNVHLIKNYQQYKKRLSQAHQTANPLHLLIDKKIKQLSKNLI